MQRVPLILLQRPWTQASFRSATIKITCEQVIDYSDADEDANVIGSSKVAEQFNLVKSLSNVFTKTIPSELPLLRNMNHRIDRKPESEWLPT